MPGYYHQPRTIDDLLRHLVLKILDAANVEHNIAMRWKENTE
jgi:4-hydroxy-3-polyprenylbenzoate decarboxylase